MVFDINWYSQKGSRTADNRDYCGLGLCNNSRLMIVLDGSTCGKNSGELSKKIAYSLINWFIVYNGDVSVESIIKELEKIHIALREQFKMDSSSYVIAYINSKAEYINIIHAGDCLLGLYEEKSPIKWQIKPHTLENIVQDMTVESIAKSPIRNRLTRSFKSREFIKPEITRIEIDINQTIILATDGFWAELSDEQKFQFIERNPFNLSTDDDVSALQIQFFTEQNTNAYSSSYNSENLYIRQE